MRTGCGVGRGVGLAKDGEVDGVGEAVEEEGAVGLELEMVRWEREKTLGKLNGEEW